MFSSGCLSRLRKRWFGCCLSSEEEKRVLFNGLDSAGKTSILYRWKLGEVVTTIPTIGFNVETVKFKNIHFTCWDVGGKDKIRPLFRHYYQGTEAVLFVVDSNDTDRIDVVRDELHRTMNEDALRDVPLLVLANKQDLPNAMSPAEIADKLGLYELRPSYRQWHIQPTSATTGKGLQECLAWLHEELSQPKTTNKSLCPPPVEPSFGLGSKEVDSVTCATSTGSEDDFLLDSLGDNSAMLRELADQSYVVVQLGKEEADQAEFALTVVKEHLQKGRRTTMPSDDVDVKSFGTLEVREAHWKRHRSQLRLVVGQSTSAEYEDTPAEKNPGYVTALQQAQNVLSTVAARLDTSREASELIESSALDAFHYYCPSIVCAAHTDGCALTLLMEDSPGLEVRDHAGQWVSLSLQQDEVAVILGRTASNLSISGRACEHRVRVHHDNSLPRTSISFDLYAPIVV